MFSSRVTLLAIGVSQYSGLKPLRGPNADLKRIKNVFTSSDVSLYGKNRDAFLENPTSEQVRKWLLDYASARSAAGDILLFYFSGHGVVIGSGEFAYCLSDTRADRKGEEVFPLSTLYFNDVVETLASVDVYPVFIIDACYSGAAAHSRNIDSASAMGAMHDTVHRQAGSSYAILCACSARHTALDESDGGAFTKLLCSILAQGLASRKRQQTLDLQDVFPVLQTACEKEPDLNAPRLYLGPSLPRVPLCRNAAFEELAYSFTGYMATLVREMWNNGKPKFLTHNHIRSLNAGAYGNHRKLSFAPWALVENGDRPKERRLTERGKLFAQGLLEVPREIRAKSQDTSKPDSWEPKPGTSQVRITDFP